MKTTIFFQVERAMERAGVLNMLLAENAAGVFVPWPGPDYQNAHLQPLSAFGGEPIPDSFLDIVLTEYSKYSKLLTEQQTGASA